MHGAPKEVRERIIAQRKAAREEYDRKVAAGEIIPRKQQAAPLPWPQTFADMAARCGPYAELTTLHAKAQLACTWKRGPYKHNSEWIFPGTPEPVRKLIWECCSRYQWTLLLDAGAAINPRQTLDIFSDEAWPEAVRTVEEAIAEWEAAGSIGLDHAALLNAHSMLAYWIRDKSLPDYPGSGVFAPTSSPSEQYLATLKPARRAFYEQSREPHVPE